MPFGIKYRALRWTDYAVCRQLFLDTFMHDMLPDFVAAWKQRRRDGCYVARCEGGIVGFCLVSKRNKLEFIAVHELFRDAKVGSGLLKRMLRDLADCRSIHLVTADDERLMYWYARFGFVVTGLWLYEDGEFSGADMVRRHRCRSGVKAC